ncbi:MAG: ion channel [Bdellovibrionales bacterium]
MLLLDVVGWLIAAVLVGMTIGLHYEIIKLASDVIVPWSLKRFHDRRAMMLLTVTLMAGHICEIWIFAGAMFGLSYFPAFGSLTGNHEPTFNSFLYFSAVSYTSTGYGDILPVGPLRALAVSEALTGLLMIAWSASFTYLKMEQIWNLRHNTRNTK